MITGETTRLLSDELYQHLLENIQNCTWKVGEKMPSENEICAQYKVSRVSVRSAIHKLQAQNLIVTKPGKGSFIASNRISDNLVSLAVGKMDLSTNEFKYISQLRQALEFTSIDLICKSGTDDDIALIKNALDDMLVAEDVKAYVKADYEFHYAIIKGSHNPLFESVFRGCKSEFMKYFTEMAEATDDKFAYAKMNHKSIYEAIAAKNSHQVRIIIEGSFEYNMARYKNKFKDNASIPNEAERSGTD